MAAGVTRIAADSASFVPTDYIDPDFLLAGSPNERGVSLFASDDATVHCGVWACDTYSEHLPSYPEDELYVLIEGSLVVTVDGEAPERFAVGDAFVIRQGTACTLEFSGPFRKLWMTHDPSAGRAVPTEPG
jgi:uncharacterized cupin superfamily protein